MNSSHLRVCYWLSRVEPSGGSQYRSNPEAVYPFLTFRRPPWTGDQPIARPLFIRENAMQTYAGIHPFSEMASTLPPLN
jgi:hypothetical protein